MYLWTRKSLLNFGSPDPDRIHADGGLHSLSARLAVAMLCVDSLIETAVHSDIVLGTSYKLFYLLTYHNCYYYVSTGTNWTSFPVVRTRREYRRQSLVASSAMQLRRTHRKVIGRWLTLRLFTFIQAVPSSIDNLTGLYHSTCCLLNISTQTN